MKPREWKYPVKVSEVTHFKLKPAPEGKGVQGLRITEEKAYFDSGATIMRLVIEKRSLLWRLRRLFR